MAKRLVLKGDAGIVALSSSYTLLLRTWFRRGFIQYPKSSSWIFLTYPAVTICRHYVDTFSQRNTLDSNERRVKPILLV